ncbi:MAG TPA: hypothetical protein VLW17_04260, partial [Thermoanaerobaculaceae bacterium]|nr:hypothetical protein [Thermoanaerobaculaceae bacterium]
MTRWLGLPRGQARLLLLIAMALTGVGLVTAHHESASDPARPPGEPAQNAPSSAGLSDLVPLAAGQTLYV